VRITCRDGDVAVDGPSSGRGAWLCRADEPSDAPVVATCLDAALASRGFARAWRLDVGADLQRRIRVRLGGSDANDDEPGAQ
jgi:hypothetical protein